MTSTGRPPVRFGLDDPRVQHYMVPSKKAPSPTSFGSAFHQPKSAHTAAVVKGAAMGAGVPSAPGVGEQGVRASYVTETQRHYGPSSLADSLHTQEPRVDRPARRESINSGHVGTLRQRAGSDGLLAHVIHRRGYGSHDRHEYYGTAQGYGYQTSAPSTEFSVRSAPSDRLSTSTPPSPLPSPSPSLTPMSPDRQIVPHLDQGQRHAQDYDRTHAQHSHQPMGSSSPPCLEMERDADSKGVPSHLRFSPTPLFTSALQHQRPRHHSDHNIQLPPMISREANHINNTASRASTSAPVSAPIMDSRAVTPPASAMAWSSKHHHHRIPVRSPERIGQDVMTTSTTNTESSAYMIMDYYQLYLQNPRALRPEGGRYDERQRLHRASETAMSASAYDEGHSDAHSTSHTGGLKSKGKSKARVSATTMNKAASGSYHGLSRRQSMPLFLTATGRVLRNEDAKQNMDSHHSAEVVHGLGIQSVGSTSTSSSSRPTPMSIHNLLTDDTYFPGDFDSEVFKCKKDESEDEPKKRQRMSKKRAAELGLLDEDGNLITKRKRTKKAHDPDHVSPSGFRHGGERVVQEPDELVILEPDVGPVSMLDNVTHPPPKVIWKGTPLSVKGRPGYEQLHAYEEYIASTLRLSPAQYLSCKRTLILASRQYHANPNGKQFRKSDAQKLCRIDVNKTSRLWEAFAKIGWLEGISEKDI
ncbi:hypothetical protein BG011_000482 [Mortierella polycephala]|uniref:SWIRM domain-containing protein n=1 Tax=Mortierella polycephala TaxID=41804 RepID=A0A9P6QID9_9FUNG|nr:hypothetical protein BG011_000482 [Mortierella polycephala]